MKVYTMLVSYRPNIRNAVIICSLCIILSKQAEAQPVAAIEKLGIITSNQIHNGLGFNISGSNKWEFALASQAGAIEARFQCEWSAVEIQTSTNTSGGYALPSHCINGLQYSQRYNLHPLIVAAYGPPYREIATLAVTGSSTLAAGVYTVPVSVVSGTLANVKFPFDLVKETSGTQITANEKWAYGGALITRVDYNKSAIFLAAQTAITLPVGTKLVVNELLYPSVAGDTADDPSVAAYSGGKSVTVGGYVGYLAQSIASAHLQGRVEIWNEPPWPHDLWDTRYRFYDRNTPSNIAKPAVQFGFAAALETQTPPPGVRYNWGGTHKSGFNSLLGPRMSTKPSELQIQRSISSESFHPYGNNPEDHAWDPDCLARASPHNWGNCALMGTLTNSNIKYEAFLNLVNIRNSGWGIERNITEIGEDTEDQIVKARFIIRSFLTYQSLGFSRVDFYRLADPGARYGFVDSNTQIPQASYYAIKSLMATVNTFSKKPVSSYTASYLPSVVSYSGHYPLTVVQIVGSRTPKDGVNTVLYASWQRSFATSGLWIRLSSPMATPLTVRIPAKMQVKSVMDLVTLRNVDFNRIGNNVTYRIADNPVGLLLGPALK